MAKGRSCLKARVTVASLMLIFIISLSAQTQIGRITTPISVSLEVPAGELEAVGRIPGCTATLISWQTVLTAAHCVCPNDDNTIGCAARRQFTLEDVFPIDNPATVTDESATRGQVTIGGDVHVYPGFGEQGWLRRDFAVITLDQPVYEHVKGIPPIFLDSTPAQNGDELTIVGYGNTGTGCADGSLGKRKVTLKASAVDTDLIRFDNEGIHNCPGDSGGPAINANGSVVGVASWGNFSDSSTYRPAYEVFSWIAGIRDQVETDPGLREGNLVSMGTSWDLQAYRPLYQYRFSQGKTPSDIVGMGIAGSDDHVFVWYKDGTVSSGTSWDLEAYRAPYTYSLPSGKTPSDIVGMGIAGSDDHVYVWYNDGTVTSGTSWDLQAYRAPYAYSLPPGKTTADIVGMGIAGSNDHVFAWYKDGTVSSGTSGNLQAYRAPYAYSLPPGKTTADIVGMGIAGSNDFVVVWFRTRIL
jgi:hypothetical protein